jgi:hypothetical protein
VANTRPIHTRFWRNDLIYTPHFTLPISHGPQAGRLNVVYRQKKWCCLTHSGSCPRALDGTNRECPRARAEHYTFIYTHIDFHYFSTYRNNVCPESRLYVWSNIPRRIRYIYNGQSAVVSTYILFIWKYRQRLSQVNSYPASGWTVTSAWAVPLYSRVR